MARTSIDVEIIEDAINCCRDAENGNRDGISIPSKDLRLMGDVYGSMIYHKQYRGFDISGFNPQVHEVLERWIERAAKKNAIPGA